MIHIKKIAIAYIKISYYKNIDLNKKSFIFYWIINKKSIIEIKLYDKSCTISLDNKSNSFILSITLKISIL